MHFTTALITAVSTAIFAASGVQAAGNFAASCSNYYIQNNNFLWATCGDGRGGRTTSALNLNSCIGNDGLAIMRRAALPALSTLAPTCDANAVPEAALLT
ncbi:hypothetical protein RHS04_09182 [Rhizoctonia solani]|uniref:Cyanovirin-N domain-containing protein n=1 Tax=Rhizoctonia solani TaxID=456999 RepID=A0A8H7GYI0_9AGAM|nr:hypothetical protein RHS04_09182 [Rhizoctonia solani]